jgi:hypothetical protein
MSGIMFFKKQTDKAIPAEILTAHNKVMEIINKELNTYNGAVAEYSNHVRKFCEFIGDVINIGLENIIQKLINSSNVYYIFLFFYYFFLATLKN